MSIELKTQTSVLETPIFVVSEASGAKEEQRIAITISTLNVVGSVVMAFLIVASAALGLRALENKLESAGVLGSWARVSKSKIDSAFMAPDYGRLFGSLGSHIFIPTVHAATRSAPPRKYEAKFFIESHKGLTLTSGEEATYVVGFKNVGLGEWRSEGKNYISVYAAKPYYRTSQFISPLWEKDIKPGRLRDTRVAPGAIGYFEIKLKAPEKPGTYSEIFALAVEDAAWITGGQFTIPITVEERPAYAATLLLKSDNDLVLKQGEEINVKVGWKNSGNVAWKERKIVSKSLQIASDVSAEPSLFASSKWPSSTESARVTNDLVLPGQIGFADFAIRAPNRPGKFAIRFAMIADGHAVSGGEVEFTGKVTDETVLNNLPAIEPLGFTAEPNLRVGLCFIPYGATDPGQVGIDPCVSDQSQTLNVSAQVPLSLQNSGGVLVAQNIGTNVTIKFDPVSRFTVTANGSTYSFSDAVRIVPTDLSSVLVFDSWKNLIASGENDNRQHGILEFRYLEDRKRVWAINELPLELYVKGLAEIPYDWPLEVQKAQAIAARTFATYYLLAGGKHASQQHILNAGEGDQVYHGVGAELRRPVLSRAVTETSGIVATYSGGVVSTPYFAQSDGRTKSWAEVYGSPARPWLVSVDAPYDLGKTRRGHGIGMSQMDAYGMAKSGATFEQILKHYYTGIELKRAY